MQRVEPISTAAFAIFLFFATVCPIARSAEECVATSIDRVGRCNQRAFAKHAIDRGLRGIEKRPPVPPAGLDPNVLAAQLMGVLAVGELHSVGGGRHDWVLVARAASNVETRSGQYELRAKDYEPSVLTALVHWQPPKQNGEKGEVRQLATMAGRLTRGSAADVPEYGEKISPADRDSLVPCVDPEAGNDLNSSEGGYPDVNGQFRWIKLSSMHRVLAARVSRSEGYAGGGGTFEGELLFEPREGKLTPVACYAVSRYQMFGGNWNPDGTREHPESQAAWTMQPMPGDSWPRLRLRPYTRNTPGAYLSWDPKAGHYRQEEGRERK